MLSKIRPREAWDDSSQCKIEAVPKRVRCRTPPERHVLYQLNIVSSLTMNISSDNRPMGKAMFLPFELKEGLRI